MKRLLSVTTSLLLTITLFAVSAFAFPLSADAAETTFSGTVSDQTTPTVLYLDTSGGTMQIKIDASTDTSGAKFLLPGNKVSCSCYISSDEYWHASKISGSSVAGKANVDTSKQATVQGTISKGSNEEMIFLKLPEGTMELKLDHDTDMSGVKALVLGKTITVVCSRGSDAYMHAISISDGNGNTSTVSNGTTQSNPGGANVSGTINKNTTAQKIYLDMPEGTMELMLDSTTDLSGCRTLIPGEKINANVYRGGDAYMHAYSLTKTSSKASATVSLDSQQLSVSGTIGDKTTESTLYLNTSGGTMQIRLDANTNYAGTRVLIKGKTVTVNCQRGADEYYHAVTIN